jgi:hypothetical protein
MGSDRTDDTSIANRLRDAMHELHGAVEAVEQRAADLNRQCQTTESRLRELVRWLSDMPIGRTDSTAADARPRENAKAEPSRRLHQRLLSWLPLVFFPLLLLILIVVLFLPWARGLWFYPLFRISALLSAASGIVWYSKDVKWRRPSCRVICGVFLPSLLFVFGLVIWGFHRGPVEAVILAFISLCTPAVAVTAYKVVRPSLKTDDAYKKADILIKVAQAGGLAVAGLGLLLSYQRETAKRFNDIKPLFEIEHWDSAAGTFELHNHGGWAMFLGFATEKYKEERGSGWDKLEEPTTECDTDGFTETPNRYQVVWQKKAQGDSAAGFRVTTPKTNCTVYIGWVDADGNTYEQSVELYAKGDPPHLGIPSFRRPAAFSLVHSVLAGTLQDENPFIPCRGELARGPKTGRRRDKDFYEASPFSAKTQPQPN